MNDHHMLFVSISAALAFLPVFVTSLSAGGQSQVVTDDARPRMNTDNAGQRFQRFGLRSHLGHEGPLEAGWKACTAAAAKTRLLHLVNDPVAPLVHQFLCPVARPQDLVGKGLGKGLGKGSAGNGENNLGKGLAGNCDHAEVRIRMPKFAHVLWSQGHTGQRSQFGSVQMC